MAAFFPKGGFKSAADPGGSLFKKQSQGFPQEALFDFAGFFSAFSFFERSSRKRISSSE
jgi:hypothetical protein